MWYLIAEANGLTAESPLTSGQTLTIPNKIANIHNNSGTTRPYNAGAIIGDTSPTLPDAPPPPVSNDKGCGVVGMIVVIVVAIIVTYYAGPAAGEAIYGAFGGTVAAGTTLAATAGYGAAAPYAAGMAVGAAVGSIASKALQWHLACKISLTGRRSGLPP